MTYVHKTIENAAVGVAVIDDASNFNQLRKPGVAATIWRRQLPADLQDWFDNLPIEGLPSARVILRVEAVRDAIDAICSNARMPNTFNRRLFVDDVVSLSEHFARLMETNLVRIRLDVVHDDACRKFHIDAVTARLVCTYRGAGTQYGISMDGAEPKRIFSVPTGAPILLRGTKWPEPPTSGLLHRSPPIEGTGAVRFMLVIDPIAESKSET
ncbi:MAG: DUF1826 domain-containing protein [Pseudomonadota bacterium]